MRSGFGFCAALLALAFAVPVSSAQSVQAPQRAELPLETFAALPLISAPQLSPDGTRIAAKLSVRGQQYLAIIPLSHPDEQPVIITAGEDQDVRFWRWVNDDWLVLGVGPPRI